MKTITSEMTAHLALETTTLASCWRITRTDGEIIYLTDHDVDIVYDGNTYSADSGYEKTAIRSSLGLSVDNMDVYGLLDSSYVTEADIRSGIYDYATVEIFVVNWADLTMGELKLHKGIFGEFQTTNNGSFIAELRGLKQILDQNIVGVYQPECRVDLGSTKCSVPIQPSLLVASTDYVVGDFVRVATAPGETGQAQYENVIYECTTAGTTSDGSPAVTFDTTIGNTTTDGTAVFTARDAWQRHAVVDTVTDRATFTLSSTGWTETRDVDDWFNGGALAFETGDNAPKVCEIRDWVQSTRTVTLFIPVGYTIASGDLVRLYPGCDKLPTTCNSKFTISGSTNFGDNGNIKNFRGDPFVPGQNVTSGSV